MEIPLENPPHVTQDPVPVLASVCRLIGEVRLVSLDPCICIRLAEMPVPLLQFSDELVCMQTEIALRVLLYGRNKSSTNIRLTRHKRTLTRPLTVCIYSSIFIKTDQAQAIFTFKRIGMFVELVYDKRNVEGLQGAGEIILAELTKRVHKIFPDAEVKVKPMQANGLNSDASKSDREKLNRMLEEMFEEADMWLVSEFPTVRQTGL